MIAIGYAALGLLVGLLTGITSSKITTTILTVIFTLAGGSLAPILQKTDAQRKLFGTVLTAFSVACLLGVVGGILLRVNRYFDQTPTAQLQNEEYLKATHGTEIDTINVQYQHGDINGDEAYRRLWQAVHR